MEEGQSLPGLDSRDLRAFLHERAGAFDGQPQDTEFSLNGGEGRKKWMITLHKSNLMIDGHATLGADLLLMLMTMVSLERVSWYLISGAWEIDIS